MLHSLTLTHTHTLSLSHLQPLETEGRLFVSGLLPKGGCLSMDLVEHSSLHFKKEKKKKGQSRGGGEERSRQAMVDNEEATAGGRKK